ncbi:hypothetical protein [Burkholderia cepacia]|uniref:hypothetical protein n=1 Tax=Burkholderia cepacia TaxID=292 RepID=UPI001CF39F8A|nr:hypothetical protein [Burkholderia cepacia]MCA7936090.1 hypothetical protein [Burkholderia cepacia]
MRARIFGLLLAALASLPTTGAAAEGILLVSGKTESKITAHVIRPDILDVTDANGGSLDRGLKLEQLGGWETAYEVQARLRVVSTSGQFRVRLDEPLRIVHQSKPAQAFRSPMVRFGAEGNAMQPLAVGQGISLRNPTPPSPDVDSIGFYDLAVSAFPPEGDFKSTSGTYTGTLALTFEPLAVAP